MRTWNLLCLRFAFDSCRARSRTGHSSLVSADLLQVKFFHQLLNGTDEVPHHVDTLLWPPASLSSCSSLMCHTCTSLSHLPLLSTSLVAVLLLPMWNCLQCFWPFFCHSPRPPFCLAAFVVSPFLTSPGVQNLTVIKRKIFWTLYSSGPLCEFCHTGAQRKPHNHFIK